MALNPDNVILFNDPNLRIKISKGYDFGHFWEPGTTFTNVCFDKFVFGKDKSSGSYYGYIDCQPGYVTNANMVMTLWNLICIPADGYEFTDAEHIEEVPIEKMILAKGTCPINLDAYTDPSSRTRIDTETATGFADAYAFITYNTTAAQLYPCTKCRWKWIVKSYDEHMIESLSYYDNSIAEKLSKPVAVLAFTQWTESVFLTDPFLKFGEGYDFLRTPTDPGDPSNPGTPGGGWVPGGLGDSQYQGDRTDQELSPLITPDTTRAVLGFLKKFNNMHTPRFKGYEDINGSKYVGTIENFGDEMLIESKKMLMEKPSLKRLFDTNTFKDYFDIEYSKLADAYPQHNMLEAVLKPNVLNDRYTYTINIPGCISEFIYRKSIDGDLTQDEYNTLKRTNFFTTKETPNLVITDKETGEAEVIDLILRFDENSDSTYSFFYDKSTDGYDVDYGMTLGDYGEEIYNVSITLSRKFESLPFVWIVCDNFLSEPDMSQCIIETERKYLNTKYPDTPFKTIVENCQVKFAVGTTSQGEHYIYPYAYMSPSMDDEVYEIFTERHLFLELYSEDFDINRPDSLNGGKVNLMRLVFYFSLDDSADTVSRYIYGYIEYRINPQLIELTLNTPKEYYNDGYTMLVKQEKSYNISGADSDTYSDAVTRYYPCSCHLSLDRNYYQPISIPDPGRPRLSVRFKNVTFPYYGDRGGNVSGIHVDAGTDYTNHSALKDTGVIHELGEFDGLPNYFKYLKDRNIHRSHVEVYSIRDRVDHKNQRTIDRQTSGLILDSAIPQTELKMMTGGDPVIYFAPRNPFTNEPSSYKSDLRLLISETNALSEITFTDNNTFSNIKMKDEENDHSHEPMFIYHGKRNFSLGMMDYDPELERGRVYIVSNDPIEYRNNGDADIPLRTMARICDIPTDYGQLMHVKNVAPTLLSDIKYVKSTASFSFDAANRLWNGVAPLPSVTRFTSSTLLPLWIKKVHAGQTMKVWYNRYELEENYHTVTKFDNRIAFTKNNLIISNKGTKYAVGDTFSLILGGTPIDGTIIEVNASGNVINFTLDDAVTMIPVSNFDSLSTNVKPRHEKSELGSGLSFVLTFTQDQFDEGQRVIDTTNLFNGLYSYGYDDIDDIYIWEYDNEIQDWVPTQITGPKVIKTYYDETSGVPTYKRTIESSILYNLINVNSVLSDQTLSQPISGLTVKSNVMELDDVYHPTSIDVSNKISEKYNVERAVYLTGNPPAEYNPNTGRNDLIDPHKCTLFTFDGFVPSNNKGYINEVILPKNNNLNESNTMNQTNKFMFDEDVDSYQPNMYLFMPNREYYTTKDENYNLPHGMFVGDHKVVRLSELLNSRDVTSGMRWLSNKKPISNLYKYSGTPDMSKFDDITKDINTMERTELISIYRDKFKPITDVIDRMSDSEIRNYCIINRHYLEQHESYKKEDTKMISSGEVSIPNDVDVVHGAIVNVSSEEVSLDVKMNNGTTIGMPLYIFELTSEENLTAIPSSYRVYDIDGNDITTLSILIENRQDGTTTRWYFKDDEWQRINN